MKTKLIILSATTVLATGLQAQTTAFTYQGRLNDNGAPANGVFDLKFTIYDSLTSGNVIGEPLTNATTEVSNGLFSVSLDFGTNVFTGPARYLEIGVHTNVVGTFSILSPRYEVTSSPYAVQAFNAATATSATTATGISEGALTTVTHLANIQIATQPLNAANLYGSVPLGSVNPAVVLNNQTGVTLSGTFSGDGSGLTNLVNAGAPSIANYVSSYLTSNQPLATVNVFLPITNNVDAQINGWTHMPGNIYYTNAQTGLYLVSYSAVVVQGGGNPTCVFRVVDNTNVIVQSEATVGLQANNIGFPVFQTFISSFNSGDVLQFQWASTANNQSLSGNNLNHVTVTGATNVPAFSCTIVRIQ